MKKKTKLKTPKQATVLDAFTYVQNNQWSYKQFEKYVYAVFLDGHGYGVQDTKDNYILKTR